MASVMVTVHVPACSRRRAKQVSVPDAKPVAAAKPPAEDEHAMLGVPAMTPSMREAVGAEPLDEARVLINVAALVREFVLASADNVNFISEMPYMNGKVRWAMFTFSCKASFAEEIMKRLSQIGVGSLKDGIGIVNMLPVHLSRFSTHPSPDGTSIMFAERPEPDSDSAKPAQRPASPDTVSSEASSPPPQPPPQVLAPSSVSESSLGAAPVHPKDGGEQDSAAPPAVPQEEPEEDKLLAAAEHVGAAKVESGDGAATSEDAQFAHEADSEEADMNRKEEDVEAPRANQFETFVGKFGQTIRSRVAVDSVVELVNSSAEFSFDYAMLVVVASMLAAIGLIVNNVVVIVASMLVSPLMGPILAVTFGATLRDRQMVKMGLFSELLGLGICCLVGFIGGLCSAPLVGDTWPTNEMWSRASGSAVYIGIAIAIPSGVGVALSVLGNNTSSLVGVAISASLLPPAVNTGILLAMAALLDTSYLDLNTANAAYANSRTFVNEVSRKTILDGAGWSLLLTVANIVCIWVAGFLMFKLKEVAPIEGKSDFWTTHVPRTREYNAVLRRHDPDAAQLRNELRRQLTTMQRVPGGRRFSEAGEPEEAAGGAVYNTFQAIGAGAHARFGRLRKAVFDESFFSGPPADAEAPQQHSDDLERGQTKKD